MPREISIREATLAEVLMVHNTVLEFASEPNETFFSERLAKHDRLVLVALLDKKLAGYLIGYDRDKDGSFYCWMVGVNPVYRRNGIVKKLMHYQEAWAKDHGYTLIKIKTHNERRPMLVHLITSGYDIVSVNPIDGSKHFWVFLEKQLC